MSLTKKKGCWLNAGNICGRMRNLLCVEGFGRKLSGKLLKSCSPLGQSESAPPTHGDKLRSCRIRGGGGASSAPSNSFRISYNVQKFCSMPGSSLTKAARRVSTPTGVLVFPLVSAFEYPLCLFSNNRAPFSYIQVPAASPRRVSALKSFLVFQASVKSIAYGRCVWRGEDQGYKKIKAAYKWDWRLVPKSEEKEFARLKVPPRPPPAEMSLEMPLTPVHALILNNERRSGHCVRVCVCVCVCVGECNLTTILSVSVCSYRGRQSFRMCVCVCVCVYVSV